VDTGLSDAGERATREVRALLTPAGGG
jgi:hypothetical protein